MSAQAERELKTFIAMFSLACQAGGIALCFLNGARLPDPKKVLKGSGKQVAAAPPFPGTGKGQLVIRSVSARQRPRRKAKS
ncbi:MAG TPA: hypothetical protein VJU15_13405 [Gemmatimonadales bacterium]|nr:hypothetical protein [Gemmatimonadales bacterium]